MSIADQKSEDEDLKTMVQRLLVSHNKLNEDVRTVLAQHSNHEGKIATLDDNVQALSRQMDKLRREKNVIIFNLPEDAVNNRDMVATIQGLFKHVQFPLPEWAIDDAFRIGKSGTIRPVLVKFSSTTWARKVFSKAAALREMKISMENDMSQSDRAAKKQLHAAYKKMKASGKNVIFKRNKLFLDGRCVELAEAQQFLTRAMTPVCTMTSHLNVGSLPGLIKPVSSCSDVPVVSFDAVGVREPADQPPPLVTQTHTASAPPPTGILSLVPPAPPVTFPSLRPNEPHHMLRRSPAIEKTRTELRSGSQFCPSPSRPRRVKSSQQSSSTAPTLRQSKLNFFPVGALSAPQVPRNTVNNDPPPIMPVTRGE